jgi:hypothetical protein
MTIQRSFVSPWVGWLAAIGLLLVTDRAIADALSGHVESIDPAASQLVVKETVRGTDVTVAVNDRTMIVTTRGVRLSLKNLKSGDGVGIAHSGGVATKIVVNVRPPELSGRVSAIDLDAKRVVVTPLKGEKDVTVAVDDRTQFVTTDGKSLALKDLKQGDGVGISYGGNVAWQVVIKCKPDELTGHVNSVGPDLKSFVITDVKTNHTISVAVDGDTTIVTTDGKKIPLKDLKKGDGVGIAHRAGLASQVVVDVKPPD